jgi:hypothetical protein
MSRSLSLLLGFIALLPALSLYSEEVNISGSTSEELYELGDTDLKVVKEKIVKKVKLPVSERSDLTIYGNVVVKFQDFREVVGKLSIRDPVVPVLPDFILPKERHPNQVWVAESNLWLDHRTDCTWATVNYRFKTDLGTVSGSFSSWSLERAFMGLKFCDGPCTKAQVEIGRMKIGDRFQSELMYNSRFDGVLFEVRRPCEEYGNIVFRGGVMVVDFRRRHYTWIVGVRWDEIRKSGYYVDLSYIDWSRGRFIFLGDEERVVINPAFQYRDFQVAVGYKFPIERFGRPVHGSVGWIINEAARRYPQFANYLGNQAWWLLLEVGSIVKACDWAFKIGYQWVGLLSILETDVSGIGRGNVTGGSIHSAVIFDPGLLRGNTNYKGPTFTFLYGVTDNITFQGEYWYSTEITAVVGGVLKFTKFEAKLTYAF